MHRRNISQDEFEATVSELSGAERHPEEIEVITGRHEDHGQTVLIRHGHTFVALVDDPSFLDVAESGAFDFRGRALGACTEGGPRLISPKLVRRARQRLTAPECEQIVNESLGARSCRAT